MRLTLEREKEIREAECLSGNGCNWRRDELLAEIDELRADLNQAREYTRIYSEQCAESGKQINGLLLEQKFLQQALILKDSLMAQNQKLRERIQTLPDALRKADNSSHGWLDDFLRDHFSMDDNLEKKE